MIEFNNIKITKNVQCMYAAVRFMPFAEIR